MRSSVGTKLFAVICLGSLHLVPGQKMSANQILWGAVNNVPVLVTPKKCPADGGTVSCPAGSVCLGGYCFWANCLADEVKSLPGLGINITVFDDSSRRNSNPPNEGFQTGWGPGEQKKVDSFSVNNYNVKSSENTFDSTTFSLPNISAKKIAVATANADKVSTACFWLKSSFTGFRLLPSMPIQGVSSARSCQIECQKRSVLGCQEFIYVPVLQDCWLKLQQSVADELTAPQTSGYNGPACRDCLDVGVNYPLNDLIKGGRSEVSDAGTCQQICAEMPRCTFFTYNENLKKCWPKTSDETFVMANKRETISGPKTGCVSCFRHGINIVGHRMPNMPLLGFRTPAACQSKCRSVANCKYFVQNSKGQCWLKSDRTDMKKTENFNTVSGPRHECDCLMEGKVFYGVDLPGMPITGITNPMSCLIKCQKTPGCRVFSHFGLPMNECWLKSSETPYEIGTQLQFIHGPRNNC